MTRILIWQGPSIYTPVITAGMVEWRKDESGDPLVGVQVDSMKHASKFALPVRAEAFEQKEMER